MRLWLLLERLDREWSEEDVCMVDWDDKAAEADEVDEEGGGGDGGALMSRARTMDRRASKDSYRFMSRDNPMETLVALRTSNRVTSFGFTLELRMREKREKRGRKGGGGGKSPNGVALN